MGGGGGYGGGQVGTRPAAPSPWPRGNQATLLTSGAKAVAGKAMNILQRHEVQYGISTIE